MGLEIIGAGLQHRASKKAASAQKEAAYEANQTARDLSAEQMDLYKQIHDDQNALYKQIYGDQNALYKQIYGEQKDLYKQVYNEQKAQQAPYLKQGQAAIGKLGSLMGEADPFESYLQRAGLQGGLDAYLKQKGQYDDQFESYLQRAGLQGGLDAYLKQKGVSNYGFLNSPQYQFLQKQGQQALDRSAAARGMGYSGAQMKAAQQYGQGLASQQYDNEYNRAAKEYFNKYDQVANQFGNYYNRLDNEYNRAAKEYFNKYDQVANQFGNYYNRLAALAQGGQQAATTASQLGGQYGQNVGGTLGTLSGQLQNNIGQLGNARASGYIGQANAITGGLQGITDNMFRAASLFYPKGIN